MFTKGKRRVGCVPRGTQLHASSDLAEGRKLRTRKLGLKNGQVLDSHKRLSLALNWDLLGPKPTTSSQPPKPHLVTTTFGLIYPCYELNTHTL